MKMVRTYCSFSLRTTLKTAVLIIVARFTHLIYISGKAENIWDHLTHNDPCAIKDCSNGDIADDSYHQYQRDVEMMRELGIKAYRFSLSWPRILPTSFPDQINEAGVQYYNNLIDEMLKYNIEPVITLYHWDLPQKLQELGGWANPFIVDWFGDYARTVYQLFGDRVKYWITINEPYQVCYQGYGDVSKAPRLNIQGVGEYMCTRNLLLAHARAYHIYDDEFRASQNGVVFIAFSAQWYEPESESEIMAAEEANQFMVKQFYGHQYLYLYRYILTSIYFYFSGRFMFTRYLLNQAIILQL